MEALGADVILVDQASGSAPGQVSGEDLALVEQVADRVTRERGAFRADQFELDGNFRSHFLHTGPEIWAQSGGDINAFCDFAGSGGNFSGVTKYLKQQDPTIKCFVVEPEGAAALAGQTIIRPAHSIQGGGYAMSDLKFLRELDFGGYLQVSSDDARTAAKRLAREEGIFASFSSSANLAAALQFLKGEFAGHTVCIMICDSGLKYLSTDLWE